MNDEEVETDISRLDYVQHDLQVAFHESIEVILAVLAPLRNCTLFRNNLMLRKGVI